MNAKGQHNCKVLMWSAKLLEGLDKLVDNQRNVCSQFKTDGQKRHGAKRIPAQAIQNYPPGQKWLPPDWVSFRHAHTFPWISTALALALLVFDSCNWTLFGSVFQAPGPTGLAVALALALFLDFLCACVAPDSRCTPLHPHLWPSMPSRWLTSSTRGDRSYTRTLEACFSASTDKNLLSAYYLKGTVPFLPGKWILQLQQQGAGSDR